MIEINGIVFILIWVVNTMVLLSVCEHDSIDDKLFIIIMSMIPPVGIFFVLFLLYTLLKRDVQ